MIKISSNILLVAGDGELKSRLSTTLEDQGCHVTSCNSSDDALASIRLYPPDAAVVSLDHTGSDALDLLRTLREFDPDTGFVLLADGTGHETAVAALDGVAPGCVANPHHTAEVLAMVRTALELRSLRLENRRLVESLNQTNTDLDEQVTGGKRAEQALQENTRQLEEARRQTATYSEELAKESGKRKGLEEELESLEELRRLQAAQASSEDEQKRLAEALHDNILVPLAAIGVDIGFLRRKAKPISEELEAGLTELGARIKDTDRHLRNLVWGIYPSVLTNLGLVPALRSYIEQLSRTPIPGPHPLEIELRTRGFDNGRLPEELEIGLYRVVQHGIARAIQHARAKRLLIDLTWTDVELALLIADDGVGFHVKTPYQSPLSENLGLINLRDRIEILRGTLEIESEESVGTKIRAKVPTTFRTLGTEEIQTSNYILSVQD